MAYGPLLTEEDHGRIYRAIAQHFLARSEARAAPVAIITGGQPGAGKSGLSSAARSELRAAGGYVVIDADRLRAWHPDYARLLKEDDTTAANKTHTDAGRWAAMLAREAVAERRNVIFDQTSRDADAVVALSQRLRTAGYRVELRVMAVHERVSEQRILLRYEHQKAETGHGRFATRDSHDAAFAGLPLAVGAAERGKHVDVVQVHDLHHGVIYRNELVANVWTQPPAAEAVIGQERGRPFSVQEAAELRDHYQQLAEMVAKPERRAQPAEIERMGQLLERAEREHLAAVVRQSRDRAGTQRLGAHDVLTAVATMARAEGMSPGLVDAVVARARDMLAARQDQRSRGIEPSPAALAPKKTLRGDPEPER